MHREFIAPGPGSWLLETAHSSSALTHYSAACYAHGMPLGFNQSFARYGLPLRRLQPEFVNGFLYLQKVVVGAKPDSKSLPPKLLFKLAGLLHPTFIKRYKDAHYSFSNQFWLQDLQNWDQLKQDSIARNTELQSVERTQLNDKQLIDHLEDCFANAKEMFFRHHNITAAALMPIGWFLDTATRHSDLSVAQVTPLLAGSTDVSTGIGGDELSALAATLGEAGVSKKDLDSITATEGLALIRNRGSKVTAALDEYLAITGTMLISGYCISDKTLLESPNIIMARIIDALEPQNNVTVNNDLENSIRERIPEQFRDEFDRSLRDARLTYRLRDERGIYNDNWGTGVSRTAILDAGGRLFEQGVLSNSELILDASHEEMLALLDGDRSLSEQELEERRQWRLNTSIDSVPQELGMSPVDPPPLDWFPKKAQPTIRAFSIAIDNVFDAPEGKSSGKITGLAVSPGVYEGTAKVIISTRDFDRLEEGDVLVTKNTSAGFNVVLPIIGALVTDRGGILSHAAIVTREYGIPGVVSTKKASRTIKDGDRVRVDGDNGEVTVLS
jgi:pyruvate,water dikinase